MTKKDLENWKSIGIAMYGKEALLTCTHCIRNSPSIFWCVQCGDSLCAVCNEEHPLLVRTATHTVTLLDPNTSLDAKKDKVACKRHNEKSNKYCVTCNEVLCPAPTCYRPHCNHALKVTTDCVEEFRTKVQIGNEKISKFLDDVDPMLDSIEDQVQKHLDPVAAANVDIANIFRKEFKRILDMITQSEILFRRRLVESRITKVKLLNFKRFLMKSLQSQSKQFLYALGDDMAGISNQNIVQNLGILNEHFDEMEVGIEGVTESKDPEEEDPGVIAYLPAFQKVSESLKILIEALSHEPKLRTPATPAGTENKIEDEDESGIK